MHPEAWVHTSPVLVCRLPHALDQQHDQPRLLPFRQVIDSVPLRPSAHHARRAPDDADVRRLLDELDLLRVDEVLGLVPLGLALLAVEAEAEEVQDLVLAEAAPRGQGLLLEVARQSQEREQRAREGVGPRNGAAVGRPCLGTTAERPALGPRPCRLEPEGDGRGRRERGG